MKRKTRQTRASERIKWHPLSFELGVLFGKRALCASVMDPAPTRANVDVAFVCFASVKSKQSQP